MSLLSHNTQYNLLSKGSRALTAMAAHSLMRKVWRKVTHKQPPLNPASHGVQWGEALAWGAASGLMIGMMKTVVRKTTANYYKKLAGFKPSETLDDTSQV